MDGYCRRHLKQTCSICFEMVRSTNSPHTKRLNCGHSYHLECILKWFVKSNQCPTCRREHLNDPILEFKAAVEKNARRRKRALLTDENIVELD